MAQAQYTPAQIRFIVQKLQAAGIAPDPVLVNDLLGRTFARHLDTTLDDLSGAAPKSPQPEPKVPPVSTEQLPKQELLLKLLKMTTSDNDGEALTAIRKVNTMLTTNGWDWDKFVSGKIKIVENPFVGLGTPPRRAEPTTSYKAPPTPAPPPPPPPKARYSGQRVKSLGVNRYADHCYCCGIEVMAQAGGFFNPIDYNLNAKPAKGRWSVVCSSCENTSLVWDQPAIPQRKRGKASINDLT